MHLGSEPLEPDGSLGSNTEGAGRSRDCNLGPGPVAGPPPRSGPLAASSRRASRPPTRFLVAPQVLSARPAPRPVPAGRGRRDGEGNPKIGGAGVGWGLWAARAGARGRAGRGRAVRGTPRTSRRRRRKTRTTTAGTAPGSLRRRGPRSVLYVECGGGRIAGPRGAARGW